MQEALEQAMTLNSAPGYIYAVAYSLGAVVFVCHNPRRQHGIKLWAVQLALTGTAFGFSFLTDTQLPIFFIPSLAFVLALVFLQIWCACRIPLKNTLYFTLQAFALGELFASAEGRLYYFLFQQMHGLVSPATGFIVAALVFCIFFVVMYFLERPFASFNARLAINRKTLLHTFLISFSMYLLSNTSNVYQNTPLSSTIPGDILLIRTLIDLGCVTMLYANQLQLREMDQLRENEMLRQTIETQYANYRVSEQSMALVQQKYHDLKHQIAYLRTELSDQEKIVHLDRMEDELRSFEIMTDTGNRVLDTILSAKTLQCQNQQIELHCFADATGLSFMDPMDISALFGNALDNAIESVASQDEKQRQPIEVSVGMKKGFLVITVGNSYSGDLRFEAGLPKTSKGDERYHGFGTKSIQTIAQKYGSIATFSAEGGWFEVKIVIPTEGK